MTSCTHDVRAAGWHRGGASHLFLPWLFHPPKPTKANRTGMHRVRFRLNIPIFIYIPNLPKSVPGEGCKKISVSENAKRQGSRWDISWDCDDQNRNIRLRSWATQELYLLPYFWCMLYCVVLWVHLSMSTWVCLSIADLVDLEAFVARESTPSSGGTSEPRERESLLNRGAALQCEAVLPGLLESLGGTIKNPFVFTYRTSNYIYIHVYVTYDSDVLQIRFRHFKVPVLLNFLQCHRTFGKGLSTLHDLRGEALSALTGSSSSPLPGSILVPDLEGRCIWKKSIAFHWKLSTALSFFKGSALRSPTATG